MNRRQLELQIRAVTIPHRLERQRLDTASVTVFRERARLILHSIAADVAAYPELQPAFDDAMAQVQDEPLGEPLDDTA